MLDIFVYCPISIPIHEFPLQRPARGSVDAFCLVTVGAPVSKELRPGNDISRRTVGVFDNDVNIWGSSQISKVRSVARGEHKNQLCPFYVLKSAHEFVPQHSSAPIQAWSDGNRHHGTEQNT